MSAAEPGPPGISTARIEAALRRLGEEHVPPVGWQRRVLDREPVPPRRSWWLVAVPLLTVALAGTAVVALWLPSTRRAEALQLARNEKPVLETSSVPFSGAVYRGEPTRGQLGDMLHVRITRGPAARALWIYRDRELVAVCPGDPGCRESGDALVMAYRLSSVGEYTLVAVTGLAAIGRPPVRGQDADLAYARRLLAEPVTRAIWVR